jgi:hypothetical protein
MSGILGPKGQNWVEVGGERCWLQRVKGDIVVSFQWLHVGKKEPQACMVLFPATLKLDGGAYAIPQENAYEYVTSNGAPTPYLMTAAFNAAQSMGFYADQSTTFRIVDIIADGLSDLVRMPSEQPASLEIKAPVIGIEATAKVEGQIVHQEVL